LNYVKEPKRYGTIFNPNYVTPFHVGKRRKYVTTIHDLQYLHFREFFSKKKRLFQYISHLNTLKFADKVICISDFVKDDIIQRFGSKYADKLVTIHNPVDFERLEQASDGAYDFKYILCVSALFPHKNMLTLVKAFEEFQKRTNSSLKLVLAGQNVNLRGGNFAPYQHHLVEMSSKNENIIYTGYISDEKLGQLYQHCEFFVLPSLFEGFGFPVIEALGLGKPVITTRCGSLAEVSLNHAIYVDDPNSHTELAEKMMYVSSKIGELNQYYVSNAEKFRKEYNVKRLAKSYLEALEFKKGNLVGKELFEERIGGNVETRD
jgi:glycosyltransferase involved in cell wall biosynthesis